MEHAIIMASGLGTRMRPLTEKVPKPLIKVCGKPMIETVIEGLLQRNISQIGVVVGYLKEQFYYLKNKYPNLIILENGEYREVNNISSVYVARNLLKGADCYICEADLYIADDNIFMATPKESCYFGKMVKGYSDDWVFELDEDKYIKRIGKEGVDSYNMVGISYFKRTDASKLAGFIEERYGKAGYETLFWDEVVDENLDQLKLRVREVKAGQVMEIDSVEELYMAEEMIKGVKTNGSSEAG